MTYRILKTLLAILSILCIETGSSSAASSTKTIILTTQNWPPYQISENNELNGFAVDVVRCVLDKMNQPYEIKVYPWKRSQVLVEKNSAHGFFSASHNNIRDQYATMSNPIASQVWNWYLLKESVMNPTHETFKSTASVTAMFGSNMLTWLKQQNYNVIGHTNDTDMLLKLLLDRRIDAILANKLVAERSMKGHNINPDRFKVYINKNKPLGVYWSNKFLSENPGFLEHFNRLISDCKQ